jgi:6-phosphogluconolactonase (cycloisomerase 2 family)
VASVNRTWRFTSFRPMLSRLIVFFAAVAVCFFAFSGRRAPVILSYPPTSLARMVVDPTGDMCTWWGESVPEVLADPQGDASTITEGQLPPVRYVLDPYPTFNGIVLDTRANRVLMSDENRKSVLTYERSAGSTTSAVTSPMWQIIGPQTEVGFIAGVEIDPERREIYAVNNDVEDRIAVFDYDASGDLKPKRHLYVPHQSWGISLNGSRGELAISVQQLSMVAIYRRDANGMDAPLRVIKGSHTNLADAHGIRWDAAHHEIIVASHGNSTEIAPYTAYDAQTSSAKENGEEKILGGKFVPASINVFDEMASGDAKPARSIQGPDTKLNWPMGIDLDGAHDEIAVANNGDNSILIFRRTAQGNVAPVRMIRGTKTGISSPMGVAIDAEHNELWVANYGDHTALVFARDATGDAAPKRIIRNAPAGTPTGGFGNPYAVAYDSKRDQLLVPN